MCKWHKQATTEWSWCKIFISAYEALCACPMGFLISTVL